ncbi:hypothetical protein ACFPQ1_21325 [Rhodocytophaga aerolata]|uniref:hypothetical protein n=1 Tax=Rhodocytophaga aerolata TaxID=455078 RepID=UPI0036099606
MNLQFMSLLKKSKPLFSQKIENTHTKLGYLLVVHLFAKRVVIESMNFLKLLPFNVLVMGHSYDLQLIIGETYGKKTKQGSKGKKMRIGKKGPSALAIERG